MTPIDPTRLSRVLNSLIRPRGQKTETANVTTDKRSDISQAVSPQRNPDVLRTSLRKRLTKLRQTNVDFHSAAPTITIQEILRWEFGDEILSNPAFDKVVQNVTHTMMGHAKMSAAMQKIIDALSAD